MTDASSSMSDAGKREAWLSFSSKLFDLGRDIFEEADMLVTNNANSPRYKTFGEFIAYARAKPHAKIGEPQ